MCCQGLAWPFLASLPPHVPGRSRVPARAVVGSTTAGAVPRGLLHPQLLQHLGRQACQGGIAVEPAAGAALRVVWKGSVPK